MLFGKIVMDAKQELTNMLKGFVEHQEAHEEHFKLLQKKKTYRGPSYKIWLETSIRYWTKHYNKYYCYGTITIQDANLIYNELLINYKPEKIQLEMKR